MTVHQLLNTKITTRLITMVGGASEFWTSGKMRSNLSLISSIKFWIDFTT